ncbi:hypothetical protein Sdia_29460 [Streptomyces diastaticus subsp. diastaticus]|uniref:Uncharacterized protein n=1 Tax=Streptomyces diastaticus subsp. diastaticus TaxID=68040 RepID=A0ABQ1CPT5_STRDI|nr:hypothetical protein Sdia_29460 [Streptomyces diastaticus subsp. diastaticus]GGU26340.1 hypothetical protein GCM10015534_31070 [Streptomyces diastaticus subsp. diastaticus]
MIRLRGSGAIVDGPDGDDGLRGSRAVRHARLRRVCANDRPGPPGGRAGPGGPARRDRTGWRRPSTPATPAHARSVRRPGYRREGHSPGFQAVDGQWRDHEAVRRPPRRYGRPARRTVPADKGEPGSDAPRKRRPWSAKAPGERCPPAA